MKIGEFAKRYGVTERLLRYYDTIGLLKPDEVDRFSGYRTYSEASGERLKQILFYRELEFPLSTIRMILDNPAYDAKDAVREQKRLLLLKKERLEKMILLLDKKEKGEDEMKKINCEYEKERDRFEEEAKERWGKTAAYREYEDRKHTSGQEPAQDALEEVLRDFGAAAREKCNPDEPRLMELVKRLQECITKHYYTCTDEILKGLGSMYVADERFRTNIDKHGEGTAELISRAIESYLKAKGK